MNIKISRSIAKRKKLKIYKKLCRCNCKVFGTKYFKKIYNSLAYNCKGCIYVKINKCNIVDDYVKF